MHNPNRPRISQEFKALIPPLSKDEYTQLEQNILAHGCRDPITLWRGAIVDGHNRYAICTKHGLKFNTTTLRLPNREAAKLWMLENQLGRRNLSDAARIELAALKIKLLGQKSNNKALAQETKLSEKTIQHYMQVKTSGDKELLQKLINGDMKIYTARKRLDKACPRIAVTCTTLEELPFRKPTPDELNDIYAKTIDSNIAIVQGLYAHLARNRARWEGMYDNVAARLGLQEKRLARMVG